MMATFSQTPEEGRPPESPGHSRKYIDRKLCPVTPRNTWSLPNNIKHSYNKNTSQIIPSSIDVAYNTVNNNLIEDDISYVTTVNINLEENIVRCQSVPVTTTRCERNSLKQSLPRLLCLKRPAGCEKPVKCNMQNNFNTLNVSALQEQDMNLNKKSLSYYKVDESASKSLIDNINLTAGCYKTSAASCSTKSNFLDQQNNLLERQKNRNSFHQDVEEALSSLLWQPYEYQNKQKTPSTCSSCSSVSSFGLDENTNNSPLVQSGNYADLYLQTEMVNNLAAKNLLYQSPHRAESRDSSSLLSASRLSVNASSAEYTRRNAAVSGASEVTCGDVNASDMQLEVSNNVSSVPQSNVLNINTSGDGLRANVTVPNAARLQHENTFIRQTVSNLSSANVVGLPQHPRYGSVPSTAAPNRTQPGSTIFPNHPRNGSEPSAMSNQFRFANNTIPISTSTNNNVVLNHQRHSSQIDQGNVPLQYTHLRSASVPKSMPIHRNEIAAPNKPVTSPLNNNISLSNPTPNHSRANSEVNSRPNQKVPPLNVSNVNVNFYRAVPVNVVSSVPSIQCLNTLSNDAGNNVSNVQIMPLGQSGITYYQPQSTLHINNNSNIIPTATNTTTSLVPPINSAVITGTTQVTVHNPQTPSHSIQIPSTFQMPIQQTRNTSTNTISMTPQNNIQNPRISTTNVVPATQVTIHNNRNVGNIAQTNFQQQMSNISNNQIRQHANNEVRTRTFTSTEAQTDEISVCPPAPEPQPSSTREQRRRERRERRHQRRSNNINHRHSEVASQASTIQNDRLPDILNSHLPPPYSTLPHTMPPPNVIMPNPAIVPTATMVPTPQMIPSPQMLPPQMVPAPRGPVMQTVCVPSGFAFPPPAVVPGQVPLVQEAAPVAVPVSSPTGFRLPFQSGGFRRGRFSEEPPKGCCGLLAWKPGSLRWFIALIALVAVCCVLVGTALGAMRPAGRDHLTVSLLMIGVGIVLVTVSGVAWRLTSHDSSTCRSMLGLGSTESVDVCARRFVPRLPPTYGRPHHPYAAMMYPEFQYRPPPPSYQASMQEYRLRLLLLDRGNTPQIQASVQNAISPPPTYRSHAGSLLRAPLSSRREAAQSEYSCPPSYRSQNSSHPHGTLQNNSVLHSREQSLSLSESNNGGSVVNVVNMLESTEEDIALDNITLDSLKMEPENDINPLRMLLKASSSDLEGSKDGNLVTIVQTSDQSPVIVTVSGSSQVDNNNSSVQITEIPSEMEILAHL